jgi:hypothetical protein
MPDKIDVAMLVDEAIRLADAEIEKASVYDHFDFFFHKHFARLVAEECIRACNEGRESAFPISAETAIRERMP